MDVSGIYLAAALANIFVGLGAFAWYTRLKKVYLNDTSAVLNKNIS
jgi:hypothetical protein